MYAEVMQVVGTVVTITGLVVVAPYEAGRVVPDVWRAIRSGGRRARVWLSSWLPFLHLDATIHGVAGGSVAIARSAIWGVGRVGLTDQGTTEEQLAAIRHAVESIYSELTGLREGQNALKAELTQRLDQLTQDLAELRRAIADQQQTQRKLNAKGFPLAALGALLAGTPASWLVLVPTDPAAAPRPTWAWWLLLGLGAVGMGVAEAWRRSQADAANGPQGWGVEFAKGWSEGWAEARPPRPAQEPPPALTTVPDPVASGQLPEGQGEEQAEPEVTA